MSVLHRSPCNSPGSRSLRIRILLPGAGRRQHGRTAARTRRSPTDHVGRRHPGERRPGGRTRRLPAPRPLRTASTDLGRHDFGFSDPNDGSRRATSRPIRTRCSTSASRRRSTNGDRTWARLTSWPAVPAHRFRQLVSVSGGYGRLAEFRANPTCMGRLCPTSPSSCRTAAAGHRGVDLEHGRQRQHDHGQRGRPSNDAPVRPVTRRATGEDVHCLRRRRPTLALPRRHHDPKTPQLRRIVWRQREDHVAAPAGGIVFLPTYAGRLNSLADRLDWQPGRPQLRVRCRPPIARHGHTPASRFQVQDDGGTANGGGDTDPTPHDGLEVTAIPGSDRERRQDDDAPTKIRLNHAGQRADFGFTTPATLAAIVLANVLITTPAAAQGTSASTASINRPIRPSLFGRRHRGGQVDLQAGRQQVRHGPRRAPPFQARTTATGVPPNVNIDPTPNVITVNVTSVNDAAVGTSSTTSSAFEDQS